MNQEALDSALMQLEEAKAAMRELLSAQHLLDTYDLHSDAPPMADVQRRLLDARARGQALLAEDLAGELPEGDVPKEPGWYEARFRVRIADQIGANGETIRTMRAEHDQQGVTRRVWADLPDSPEWHCWQTLVERLEVGRMGTRWRPIAAPAPREEVDSAPRRWYQPLERDELQAMVEPFGLDRYICEDLSLAFLVERRPEDRDGPPCTDPIAELGMRGDRGFSYHPITLPGGNQAWVVTAHHA